MKCRVCIDGDCHLCTRYVGSVEIEGEQVQDCCCLHQFDPPRSASSVALDPAPSEPPR